MIVIEYAKDGITQKESHTLKVIKGTPGSEAKDPDIVTGNISRGDIIHQMPLYRVKLDGINVTAVEKLFKMGGIRDLGGLKFQLVSALPPDAASHRDIVYLVTEGS